jgi:predicted aminopeptidase
VCIAAAALGLLAGLCGCETARYYRQAVRGQYEILSRRQPIAELIDAPGVDTELRRKFELVLRLRSFAKEDLRLPIDKHYLSYVDLGRRFVVWNVHATPRFSLEPRTWWYPLVGSLEYRGFFKESDAERYAERLRKEGEDVYVEGVEAYSTLGWFADPLLNTFIHHSELVLAEIIFHELAHQRLFISGDTDFNEAFATAVAEEGVQRWLLAVRDKSGYDEYRAALRRNGQFVRLVMEARRNLGALYEELRAQKRAHPEIWDQSRAITEKERIISGLREDYEKLKASWGGYSGYDAWFARPINNAQLNTIAVYYELVPAFRGLLEREGGDLDRFYRSVDAIGRLRKELRYGRLKQWGQEGAAARPQEASP